MRVPSTAQHHFLLHVVLLREGDIWAVCCLEHDIVAQGHSTAEALEVWGRTVLGQAIVDIKYGKRPLSDTRPSPPFYHRAYKEAAWRQEEPFILSQTVTQIGDEPLEPPVLIQIVAYMRLGA